MTKQEAFNKVMLALQDSRFRDILVIGEIVPLANLMAIAVAADNFLKSVIKENLQHTITHLQEEIDKIDAGG